MNDPAPPLSHCRKPGNGRARASRSRRIRAPFAFPLIFTIMLSSAFGYAAEEGDGAPPAPPRGEDAAARRDYVVWPLVFVDEAADWRQFSFIPFYVEREAADDSEKRVQILWPIFMYRRSGSDVSIRVVPLFTYWKDVYSYIDGEEYSSNYMLFPIVFGSDSSEDGRSFAVFPLGGRLKNFLGSDEIGFFLFPLYMEYDRGELHQRNYLWPVLSFSEGGGYKGFRLWPFYGYFERAGTYRKEFVLWPIYSRQRFDLNKEQPGERVLLLPLFAREDSSRRRYRAVVWPFFSHEINYAGNFEERSMPWPFIVIARGDFHRTQLWPLYGFTQTDDTKTRFVAWPLWRRRVSDLEDGWEMRETLLLPFWSGKTEISESEGVRSHRVRMWPLWRFRRSEDGSTRLRMLSLLWFDDERGFERQYSPLWTIYERETAPDGAEQASALWGLYRRRTGADGRSEARIPILFSRRVDAERGIEETRILGGLIAGVKRDGMRRLRLLHFSDSGNEKE